MGDKFVYKNNNKLHYTTHIHPPLRLLVLSDGGGDSLAKQFININASFDSQTNVDTNVLVTTATEGKRTNRNLHFSISIKM